MPGIFVSAPLTRPPVQLSANTTLRSVAFSKRATRRAVEVMDICQNSECRIQNAESPAADGIHYDSEFCILHSEFSSPRAFPSATARSPFGAGRSIRSGHDLRVILGVRLYLCQRLPAGRRSVR